MTRAPTSKALGLGSPSSQNKTDACKACYSLASRCIECSCFAVAGHTAAWHQLRTNEECSNEYLRRASREMVASVRTLLNRDTRRFPEPPDKSHLSTRRGTGRTQAAIGDRIVKERTLTYCEDSLSIRTLAGPDVVVATDVGLVQNGLATTMGQRIGENDGAEPAGLEDVNHGLHQLRV